MRKVNWELTLIMSCVFGSLGVDRFLMGHVGLGLLKLFTAGGCGFWYVIDIILIATKSDFQDIVWVNSHGDVIGSVATNRTNNQEDDGYYY